MMAWRYLRSRKAEGFVSVIAAFSFLGIMLGVATLIIVMSVMNGFRAELMGRLLGLNGHLNVVSQERVVGNFGSLADVLQANVKDITGVFPMVERQALLTTPTSSNGVMVRGLSALSFSKKPVLSNGIREGSLARFQDDGAAIGVEMAKRMNLHLGDQIVLISPQGKATPFGTMPRSRSFTVAGSFNQRPSRSAAAARSATRAPSALAASIVTKRCAASPFADAVRPHQIPGGFSRASSSFAISTNPNPLLLPVNLSLIILTESTVP